MSEPVRRNTAEEIIAVVQAWQRGEAIEGAMVGSSGVAFSTIGGSREPDWNFPHVHYRPKPKPREFWINAFACDEGESLAFDRHGSEQDAKMAGQRSESYVRSVLFREVTE